MPYFSPKSFIDSDDSPTPPNHDFDQLRFSHALPTLVIVLPNAIFSDTAESNAGAYWPQMQ